MFVISSVEVVVIEGLILCLIEVKIFIGRVDWCGVSKKIVIGMLLSEVMKEKMLLVIRLGLRSGRVISWNV